MADATEADAAGWQTVAIDPAVVEARVAGLSHGFVVFDDTGTEWTRDGEKFTRHPFPNRFFDSRESGAKTAPYITVELGPEVRQPPKTPDIPQSDAAGLPAGEAWVEWRTSKATATGQHRGIRSRSRWSRRSRISRSRAQEGERTMKMRLRDLGLKPGAEVKLAVRAIDTAGNPSNWMEFLEKVSSAEPRSGWLHWFDGFHDSR